MNDQLTSTIVNRDVGQRRRLYYLDWLRVIAILIVFLFHCAKIFDYHTTDVFSAVRSPVLSAFREFNFLWLMPLFFAVSGAAVFFSLKPGPAWPFVKARITRLLIPLVIVGTFLINALYVYAIRLFRGQAGGGFFHWYPEFFDGMWGFGGNFAPLGHGTHLWYLEYLFIFSLILLPFFERSKKRIAGGLKRLSVRFEEPWALFLLFLPISAAGAGFELIGLGGIRMTGGWDPISYLLFFSYGYMIFSNGRILEIVRRYGLMFLIVAFILTALHVDTHFGFNLVIPGITRHDMSAGGALRPLDQSGWVTVQAFRGLVGWCWMVGLFGTGARLLNFSNKVLSYANEAVLPFYILHHAIILLVGAYVVKWKMGVGSLFFTISAVSMAIIIVVNELLVRRINVLRFLFGMKSISGLHKSGIEAVRGRGV
jgi:peptidoglycan/LPS O-acetylase OafA/YrhL